MAYTGEKVLFHYEKDDILAAIESNTFNEIDHTGLDFIQKVIKNKDYNSITIIIINKLIDNNYDLFKENYSVYFHTNEVIQFAIRNYHPNKLEEYEAKKTAEEESELLKEQFMDNKKTIKTRL